ncbi:hypothetical protein H4R18_002286 [Coemansia javaensis]|uniref:Uncharacterized protein n=1 Tax=Coemansia javaensis TaxID=2761396 RepID=A0A9W8HCB3_9FUNG|nr:hypothetical protein H4R18_002286 [Coemansia javaensis]
MEPPMEPVAVKLARRRRGRPPGSKNRPKAAVGDKDEESDNYEEPPEEEEEPVVVKRRRGRPPGSKNRPKAAVGDRDEESDNYEEPPEEEVEEEEEEEEYQQPSDSYEGPAEEEPPVRRRRGRPPGSKNRPKAAAAAAAGSGRGSDETARARGKRMRRENAAQLWMGPDPARLEPRPGRVDVALDRDAWARLRALGAEPAAAAASGDDGGPLPQWHRPDADGALGVQLADAAGAPLGPPLAVGARRACALAPQARGWAANVGEHVTCIDWAPDPPGGGGGGDYIAVGGLGPGSAAPGAALGLVVGRRQAGPGAIQIWRLDDGGLRLALALVHGSGRCVAAKWCPLGPREAGGGAVGVLAAAFGDGSLRVGAVPDPGALAGGSDPDPDPDPDQRGPACVRWPGRAALEAWAPRGSTFTALEWAACDVVVAGTSRGVLCAWHVGAAAADTGGGPVVCHQLHVGPVAALSVHVDCGWSQAQRDGCRVVGLADIQAVTLGADGRLRATALQFPARTGVAALQSLSRVTAVGGVYWPEGTCLFSDNDKGLRVISGRVLEAAGGDPWRRRGGDPDPDPDQGAAGQRWNQGGDRSARLAAALESPALQAAVSELHAYACVAKASGELLVANLRAGGATRKFVPQYRVLHSVAGEAAGATSSAARRLRCGGRQALRARPGGDKSLTQYRMHAPEAALTACGWARSARSASWVASATASGLLRVEDAAP